jgi:hypothetical protein
MPAGLLGLEAVDDVEKDDHEHVFAPPVNVAIAEHGKVRLVYVLGSERAHPRTGGRLTRRAAHRCARRL